MFNQLQIFVEHSLPAAGLNNNKELFPYASHTLTTEAPRLLHRQEHTPTTGSAFLFILSYSSHIQLHFKNGKDFPAYIIKINVSLHYYSKLDVTVLQEDINGP